MLTDLRYEPIERIGDGGFSTVYKCRDSLTKNIVAVKRIFFVDKDEGVPSSVIREISLLKELDHSNVIRLLDVLSTGEGVDLVFECLDCDLMKFIESYPKVAKEPLLIKSFLFQTLNAVSYCHSQKILHRDLKPRNLLVNINRKEVKLADFGLARAFGVPPRTYTDNVATLAYKAPELLLGCKYASPIDVWSVGCIFAEMVTQQPLFSGTCDTSILFQIFSMLGVPNEENWPGVTSLSVYISKMFMFPTDITQKLADAVTNLEPAGIDLLSKMLCLDPSRRITAQDALKHSYFRKIAANP